MKHNLEIVERFLKNNLYAVGLIDSGQLWQTMARSPALKAGAREVYAWLQENFEPERFAGWNEGTLEDSFLLPLYRKMGFAVKAKDDIKIQGKNYELDSVLFPSQEDLRAYDADKSSKSSLLRPPIIGEHKQWSVPIDNRKVQDNPHHQLMRYLSDYRVNLGFLSNGRYWRFYDVSKPSSEKVFYEIDLAVLLNKLPKEEQTGLFTQEEIHEDYFLYFYGVFSAMAQFKKETYEELNKESQSVEAQQLTVVELMQRKSAEDLASMQQSLRDLIYSEEGSIVELVGQRLYALHPEASLEELFEQSVILALRFLFVGYFEQKHWDLLSAHEYYSPLSLTSVAQDLILGAGSKGFRDVQDLFQYLAEGHERRKIPLFNGGLFDLSKAPLLDDDNLLGQGILKEVLKKLYNYTQDAGPLSRNLAQLSIQDLGEIYESLLDFRFRVELKPIVYVEYRLNDNDVNGYMDVGDWAVLKNRMEAEEQKLAKQEQSDRKKQAAKPECQYKNHKEIPPRTLFLVNGSMQRKQTASYYTPQALSRPLVAAALEQVKEQLREQNKTPLELKILDNACGSGHFLVEFLGEFTKYVLETLEDLKGQQKNGTAHRQLVNFKSLQKALEEEIAQVKGQVGRYIPNYEVDEYLVLKRLLLKKVIFGVDMNPLAVELSCLSLWLDTFIFGTPLSFIQHHIRCGNALMGSSIKDMRKLLADKENTDLFGNEVEQELERLHEAYEKIDHINDITPEQISESYHMYQEVREKTARLRKLLHLTTAYDWYQGLVKDKLDTGFLPKSPKAEKEAEAEKTAPVGLKEQEHRKKAAQNFTSSMDEVRKSVGVWLEGSDEKMLSHESLERLAKRYQFFHYDIEFPEIYTGVYTGENAEENGQGKAGGFDAIIGNPPWDKVMFTDDDFFPQYQSNYRQLSKDKKRSLTEKQLLNPSVKKAYEESQQNFQRHAAYYKVTYPENSTKHTNLFRLFIEKNLSLLAPSATLNYLTPSAWSYEEGSEALRKKILSNYRIGFFNQFENRRGLFPSIHRSYKFALWQLQNDPPPPQEEGAGSKRGRNHAPEAATVIPCRFMLQDINELESTEALNYPLALVAELDPVHQSLLEARHQEALDIAAKMYSRGKALDPDYIDFYQELNMTMDNDLFCEGIKLGYDDEETCYLPLYQGKHIHQFDYRFQPDKGQAFGFEYYLKKEALEARLKPKELSRMKKALGGAAGLKKLGLSKEALEKQHRFNYLQPRLAFRDIARNTDERTVIMALLPPEVSAGHSVWLSFPYQFGEAAGKLCIKQQPLEKLLWLLALGSSLALDFIARLFVDIHLSKTYFMRLPFIQPSPETLQKDKACQQLIGLAAQLVLACEDSTQPSLSQALPQLSKLAQVAGQDFQSPKSPEAREKQQDQLRCELDLAVARLYGLSTEDMRYILSTFPGMQKKQISFCAELESQLASLGSPSVP